MPRYSCPICGDPNGYPLWIDARPPTECAHGHGAHTITECPTQMRRAAREARWRRVAPHCFDANGILLPGKWMDVREADRAATKADVLAMEERWGLI